MSCRIHWITSQKAKYKMDNIICTGPVCKNADLCSDFARFIVANKCVENTPRSAESAASPPQSPHPQQHYPVAQSWWTITLIALSWTVFEEVTNALLRTLEISTKTPPPNISFFVAMSGTSGERRAAVQPPAPPSRLRQVAAVLQTASCGRPCPRGP